MDVTCERCGTRYEFDEALVSARGTTVKCTSCSHQFKVYRPDGSRDLDGWIVRTTDGRELTYRAMRELQAAISSQQIAPDDVLIPRTGGEPRRLGHIEELQSFFAQEGEGAPTMRQRAAAKASSTYTPHKGTLLGGTGARAPGAPGSDPGDGPPTRPRQDEPAPPAAPSHYGTSEVVDAVVDAVKGAVEDDDSEVGLSTLDPDPPRPREAFPSLSDDDTIGDPDSVLDEASPEIDADPPPRESTEPVSKDRQPPSSDDVSSIDPLTPTPSAARPSVLRRSDVYSDPRFSGYSNRSRPGIARWVVGVVVLGLVGVGGYTLLRRHSPTQPSTAASAAGDERVDTFLELGEERLAKGDIEGAQEQFVKASAIAAEDPRVTRAVARVAVARADVLWLHLRLVPEGTPHHDAVAQQLRRAVTRVSRTVKDAVGESPDDPIGAALQVDAYRLEGKAANARSLVAKLEGAGPEGGRALAALDLVEAEPDFASVLDRLRSAQRAERKLGRAHAMLIYALVRAEKLDEAKEELARLRKQTPGHSLLSVLSHYVEGTEPPEEAPPETESAAKTTAPRPATPSRPPADVAEPFATGEPDEGALPTEMPEPVPGDAPPETPPDAPPETPEPEPEPAPTTDLPPEPAPPAAPPVDVSDLPEFHE